MRRAVARAATELRARAANETDRRVPAANGGALCY